MASFTSQLWKIGLQPFNQKKKQSHHEPHPILVLIPGASVPNVNPWTCRCGVNHPMTGNGISIPPKDLYIYGDDWRMVNMTLGITHVNMT